VLRMFLYVSIIECGAFLHKIPVALWVEGDIPGRVSGGIL